MPLASYANEKLVNIFEGNLSSLSKQYGEAQFFASHRVVEMNIWARAVQGEVVRSYCYLGESGEVYRNLGEPTAAENGFSFLAQPVEEWETFPSEEDVLTVASAWSVNPLLFEDKKDSLESVMGYLGCLT